MKTVKKLLRQRPLDLLAIGEALDALDPVARQKAVQGINRRQMATLFEAAQGRGELTLDDIVPPAVPAMVEVVHQGKNSLPLFSRFAKVFCRPKETETGPAGRAELWGYNRNPALVETTAGPGYFVAYVDEPNEVLVDYYRLPSAKPAGWPEILPNDARLGRFIYFRMQDILRRVSKHVSVGRARRNGKLSDNWFMLCRQD